MVMLIRRGTDPNGKDAVAFEKMLLLDLEKEVDVIVTSYMKQARDKMRERVAEYEAKYGIIDLSEYEIT